MSCKINVYVANLGTYNSGELIGEWISIPMDADELNEKVAEIVTATDEDGDRYDEEWVSISNMDSIKK